MKGYERDPWNASRGLGIYTNAGGGPRLIGSNHLQGKICADRPKPLGWHILLTTEGFSASDWTLTSNSRLQGRGPVSCASICASLNYAPGNVVPSRLRWLNDLSLSTLLAYRFIILCIHSTKHVRLVHKYNIKKTRAVGTSHRTNTQTRTVCDLWGKRQTPVPLKFIKHVSQGCTAANNEWTTSPRPD